MTFHPPLWAGSTSYPGVADRQLVTHLFRTPGVLDFAGGHLKVSQRAAGANMTVDIAPGAAVISGTDAPNQGRFFCSSDEVENVAVNAAPPVGQSRIDRIYARALDADVLGGSSSWGVFYVAGTSAVSPTVPSLPASSIPLAQFTVTSSTTSITNAMIVDQRQEAALMQRGNIVAEFGCPTQEFENGTSAGKDLSTPVVRPAGFAPSLFWSASTPARMRIPWTGLWSVFWHAQITSAAGFGWNVYIRKNALSENLASGGQGVGSIGTEVTVNAAGIYLQAGEYLTFRVFNATGARRSVNSGAGGGGPRLLFHGGA